MTMTNRQLFSSAALAAVSVFTTAAAPVPTTWNVDAAHTAVSFSVRHFFTPVTGQFEAMEANLTYDRQNPENSTVRVRITHRNSGEVIAEGPIGWGITRSRATGTSPGSICRPMGSATAQCPACARTSSFICGYISKRKRASNRSISDGGTCCPILFFPLLPSAWPYPAGIRS